MKVLNQVYTMTTENVLCNTCVLTLKYPKIVLYHLYFFFSWYQLPLQFSRNTMDFPCILTWGSFIFILFIFSWQIAFSALYTVKLCYVKFVFNIYLQPYQNIFLPIKNMRNNLKFYANMKLLTYRFFWV